MQSRKHWKIQLPFPRTHVGAGLAPALISRKYWKTHLSFLRTHVRAGLAPALMFFALSVLIVACSSTTSTNTSTSTNNAVVAPTIDLNGPNGTATPPLSQYLCGAWVTDTSPAVKNNGVINVFAKFVHNGADGNPVGVDGADGTATIQWPDGSTDSVIAKTTADGLAVFSIILKPVSIDKIVLVAVTFAKAGGPSCTVPQPAYFTATKCNGSKKHCRNNAD